jgi:hypothetical protein
MAHNELTAAEFDQAKKIAERMAEATAGASAGVTLYAISLLSASAVRGHGIRFADGRNLLRGMYGAAEKLLRTMYAG